MQLKLYKRSTILLAIVVLVDILCIVTLILTRDKWADNGIPVIFGFVLFVFLLSTVYSYYDLNADKNLIKKAVSNGDVALAKIKDGSFVRFAYQGVWSITSLGSPESFTLSFFLSITNGA